MNKFEVWYGAERPVAMDAETWKGFWIHVNKNVSRGRRKKTWTITKSFLVWLLEHDYLPALPKNFSNKKLKFDDAAPEIKTMAPATVKRLIDAAAGQLKLHLLLMANCGFTSVDISDLEQAEVDLELGKITRKRSKTDAVRSVPTVEYPLWQATLAELRRYQSGDPQRFLLTESGKAWKREFVKEDGKVSKTDAIKSNFRTLFDG